MRQIQNNTNGFNQSRNSLNSSFQSHQGGFNFQNIQKFRDNNMQQQNSHNPLYLSAQNVLGNGQNFQGLNTFCCINDGHDGNPLNLVCIDRNCPKRGVICTLCMHYEHQKHETLPLQIFLSQFKEQLNNTVQQNQIDENGNNPIDIMLEQVMQVQNEVIESLKIFSQKTFEAIQKTKDYLYQIFLQEIHGYQTMDMRVADLQETVKMYDNSLIRNSNHHIEQIQKMVSKITTIDIPENNNFHSSDTSFKLEVFPQQYGIQLEEIYSQIINVQENIENEIQEMHHQIQLSLQNILDFSTIPKQSIQSFTLNGQSNQPSSAHFPTAQQNPSSANITSSHRQTTSTSAQTRQQYSSSRQFQQQQQIQQSSQLNQQRSVSSGLPPPSQGSNSKIQPKNLNHRNQSSNLNSSFQSESSQFNNLVEYQPNNTTHQSRRRETHILSRSYASSASPKEQSPNKNNLRQYTNQSNHSNQSMQTQERKSSNQHLKGIVSHTPNFNMANENFILTPLSSVQAHNNVIRDMVSVGDNKFATCSYDSIIKMWNKGNQQLIQELKGHTDEVYQLAYSKKHNLLASSSYDKTIRIWKEYSEWKQLVTLRGHTGKTWAVKFIDVTNKLATGGNDRIIRIWNIFNGECENLLEGHQDTIWSLSVLNDSVRIASGDNKYIKVWDHKAGKIIKSIQAHDDRIYQLKEVSMWKNTRQSILISTSMDRKVKVWDSKNYNILFSFSEQMIITSLEMILDRNIIVVGLWGDKKEGGISFWHLPLEQAAKENYNSEKQPQKIKDYMGNYSGVSQLIYDSEVQKLFTSHSNGSVEVTGLKWK